MHTNSPPARLVLDQLPNNLSSHPLTTALTGLLASAWERKHANVYSRTETLFNMAGQQDFIDPRLGVIMGPMTTAYIGEDISKVLVLSDPINCFCAQNRTVTTFPFFFRMRTVLCRCR